MIRAVLFDIDGTLVRTNGAGVRAFARVFATQFDIENGTESFNFAGRTDYSIVRDIFNANGVEATEENYARFFDTYVFLLDHFLQESQGRVLAGVKKWLQELDAFAPRPLIGLLTGNIQLGAQIKLRHYGIWDSFETGGFADDHHDRGRIAEAAKKRAEKALGKRLKGHEVLVIGDTPLDIACARQIGAKVLAVATGPHPVAELLVHKADWVAETLDDIRFKDIAQGV